MTGIFSPVRDYFSDVWRAWNNFWFTAVDPATLAIIRLLAGGMMLYTHFIWSFDLAGFIGREGYMPVDFLNQMEGRHWSTWTIFDWIGPNWLLWTVHILALGVFACLFLGLFSRIAAVLAYLLAVSYVQRVTPGAYFGLDKTNCMLAMYLLLGPCGARYSLDRLWRLRRGDAAEPEPSVSANIAIRLMQLHLCVVYFFSALAKLEGETWKVGTALWWSASNYEYQSLDLTWLAGWPHLVAAMTLAAVFWEIFYCVLVWNPRARPLVLAMAVLVHGGIALAMGMITFGLVMLIANLAFVPPGVVRKFDQRRVIGGE